MDANEMDVELPIGNAALSSLSSLVYHLYQLDDGEVHHEDSISLSEFVNRTALVLDLQSSFQKDVNGLQIFPGEKDPRLGIEVTCEEGKKVARTILKAIWRNEGLGIAFGGFGFDNIQVTRSGKAKFRGVTILRNLSAAQVREHALMNYRCARTVISAMYGENLPDDIGDLLGLLQLPDLVVNEHYLGDLLHIHASLIPLANYSTLYKEVFDHMIKMIPKNHLYSILDEMTVDLPEYVTNWRNLVSGNDLLLYSYRYNRSLSYLPAANNPAGQTILTPTQRVVLDNLDISKDGRAVLTQEEIDRSGPLQLLIFLRHRPAHRMDHIKDFLKDHQGQCTTLWVLRE